VTEGGRGEALRGRGEGQRTTESRVKKKTKNRRKNTKRTPDSREQRRRKEKKKRADLFFSV